MSWIVIPPSCLLNYWLCCVVWEIWSLSSKMFLVQGDELLPRRWTTFARNLYIKGFLRKSLKTTTKNNSLKWLDLVTTTKNLFKNKYTCNQVQVHGAWGKNVHMIINVMNIVATWLNLAMLLYMVEVNVKCMHLMNNVNHNFHYLIMIFI